MLNIIKLEIYHDGEYYCGKSLDFDIFTQGKTLDEVVQHLKEAIKLHLDGESQGLQHLAPNPPLLALMDLGKIYG